MEHERFHIFCGHFGSGKSEIAINYAIKCAEEGKNVSIVDLDIVNPYFRTNDARKLLEKHGIEVIAPEFANSNLDMPTVPGEIMKVFNNPQNTVIFDVGGDEDGAFALGRYMERFKAEGYQLHLVVNQKRPLTETAEDIYTIGKEIEKASRLSVTDVWNNTNIGKLTDAGVLADSVQTVSRAAMMLGVGVACCCGLDRVLEGLPKGACDKKFIIDIKIKMPWEQQSGS